MSYRPTAILTGSAQRIGRTLALRLAQEGYDIGLHFNSSRIAAQETANEITALGARVCLLEGDLTQEGACERIFCEAREALGPITTLVHNAALFKREPEGNVSRDIFNAHMTINCFAPILLSQIFFAQLSEKTPGNIISLVDGTKEFSNTLNFLSYRLSKDALVSATQLLAREYAPRCRVNAIALGPTLEGESDAPGVYDSMREASPLKRITTPQEVADAMMFLLESPAITGHILPLNNGL